MSFNFDANSLLLLCLLFALRGWFVMLIKGLLDPNRHQRHREVLAKLPTWLDWFLYVACFSVLYRVLQLMAPETLTRILHGGS